MSRGERLKVAILQIASDIWAFANSKTGRGILKCSLAYLIGSLVTFIPTLAAIIGDRQDSKHMVATVVGLRSMIFHSLLESQANTTHRQTVYFHPARTIGSMHLATVLGLLAFLYAGVIGFTSMAISVLFAQLDLLVAGRTLVLIVFVGGGLGTIAWTKQHFGDPLVNVACSLASLGSIIVLIKEGAIQAGQFSEKSVVQILLMVLLGVLISTCVNVLILPSTARSELRQDLKNSTDILGELLISISRAFLSGRENDLQDEYFTNLQEEHQNVQLKITGDLAEARNEYFVLGRERVFHASTRLADCIEELSQGIGGLRSAALAQFALLKSGPYAYNHQDTVSPTSKSRSSTSPIRSSQPPGILDVITEVPDETESPTSSTPSQSKDASTVNTGDNQPPGSTSKPNMDRRASAGSLSSIPTNPGDLFLTFLRQLGPSTKSLVFTIKQTLDALQFNDAGEPEGIWRRWFECRTEVRVNPTLRCSLHEAVELYRSSRQEGIKTLFASRSLSAALRSSGPKKPASTAERRVQSTQKQKSNGTPGTTPTKSTSGQFDPSEDDEVVADIEEVSACCGHFSFSLLDFAEGMLAFLDRLEELRDAVEIEQRTWHWLNPWRHYFWLQRPHSSKHRTNFGPGPEHGKDNEIPEIIRKLDRFGEGRASHPWYYWIYERLDLFRRDDVKFAIKVGLGAGLFALPANIASTRPFFRRWRGEWGLISYMVVVSMSIGASNTTTISRFLGTFLGAVLATTAWIVSMSKGDPNPIFLAFFGLIVAAGCFYLILAKGQGPMGRFTLLTYNLVALYAYSLSRGDDRPEDDDNNEGSIDPYLWGILLHRVTAVMVGGFWGIVVVRTIWPISARRKVQDGLCVLWLRMSLIWKRDPLAFVLLGEPRSPYMDIREENHLQSFLGHLSSLQGAAQSEFELRGPFPVGPFSRILERTRRMLDAIHALNVGINQDTSTTATTTPGEEALLLFTREARFALSARISHLFSVLASSFKLEYPLHDVLPSIEHSRDRLLSRISDFRRCGQGRELASEADFEVLYTYVLVTGQLAREIEAVSREAEGLFGALDKENLRLE